MSRRRGNPVPFYLGIKQIRLAQPAAHLAVLETLVKTFDTAVTLEAI
jgi:hypothetical protein